LPALIAALLISVLFGSFDGGTPDEDHTPKLLLNAQRLRRLKRDRERQTPRWINFERRVRTAADSPERGFELALYYAVTGDQARGKEAAAWAGAHPCDARQVALIADWVRIPIPARTKTCPPSGASEPERLRNAAFLAIAEGDTVTPSPNFLAAVSKTSFEAPEPLYAAIEYIDAIRSARHQDVREGARAFFVDLPGRFLLSLPSEQLDKPRWQTHAAALALVSIDPNLEGSQFLQGWAMEEAQMVQEGPGVAYEFLWANPYLPGVSYQNMEPALYDDEDSRLVARSSWEDGACRIEIAPGKVTSQQCPPDWRTKPVTFGRLLLIPMEGRCVDLPTRPNNTTTIIWKMKPGAVLGYTEDGKQQTRNADAAGMWRVSVEYHGKVCAVR
jgi:hypothetical protein